MDLHETALAIFDAARQAADPRVAVRHALQRQGQRLRVAGREYDLSAVQRVLVVGFGKASAAMAQEVEAILGDKIAKGWVSVKYGHVAPLQTIHVHEAGHPLPDANSLSGAAEIVGLISRASPQDLVICLVSGGGSAIFELLVEGISLEDLRATTDALLRSGATVNELNTLRKHLSQVKGGQLARRSAAPMISLILSDVIGSPLDIIASGPTAPDSATFADALAVIERRGVRARVPAVVLDHLARGMRGEIPETPKADDAVFARVQNVVIADGELACNAALAAAQAHGLHTLLLSTFVQGEAREVAKWFAALAKEIAASGRPVSRPACVLAGGETTVTVRGSGKGGRNQELALAAALELAGMPNVLLLSAGTDGTDGPTDAAGAMADGTTVARALARGMNPRAFLENNDAYHFFEPLGDLIVTGPTNTNVNDIMLLLIE